MLTEKEVEVMEHALGIPHAWSTHGYHYKRHGKQYIKSYRNYFQTQKDHKPYYEIWKKLNERGLAGSWIKVCCEKEYLYFDVSENGIKELEKQQEYVLKFI